MDIFERTRLIAGGEALEKMKRSRVAVFGVGGVGGYAAEALVRCGVGALDIIDADTVSPSNLNRQIIATAQTLGMPKVQAARLRALSINPDVKITPLPLFYSAETADMIDLSQYDYIADAIDTVSSKLELIKRAKALGVPVISSMGTGNKLHPQLLEVADIYSTSVCPLARVMRRELKKAGVDSLRVVYSKEQPRRFAAENGQHTVGSTPFVPAAAGLIIASEIFCALTGVEA